MKEKIFKKVVQLIAANNDIPIKSITLKSTFEELNMDSLDGLSLIDDLEQEYNVAIPNQEAMKIRTVGETVESLERLLIMQQQ